MIRPLTAVLVLGVIVLPSLLLSVVAVWHITKEVRRG